MKLLLKFAYFILKTVDRALFVSFMSYESYYSIHRKLGFPLIRLLFRHANGYKLNLHDPKTFNEKLVFDKLYERNELLPIVTDKYRVREYVKNRVGEEYLIPLVGVYEKIDLVILDKIGLNTIIKSNHGSHQHFILSDSELGTELHPNKIIEISNKWMYGKYRYQALPWFTQVIPRKIVIEKLLTDENGNVPYDFKFFVFNGKVEFIQVDIDRFSEHNRALYDPTWHKINVDYLVSSNGKSVEKPENLDDMILLAEKLAEDFKFMRVDLYLFKNKIYFGELTPYPSAGYGPFNPTSFDFELGEKIS